MSDHGHDHDHHIESHFGRSLLLRNIVIGLSDGLTVPFALAAGLTAAVTSNSLIITAGIAEIVAGSISMGLGGYLAEKTAVDHYEGEKSREYREVEEIPEEEKNEVRRALNRYGLSHDTKEMVVKELAKNKHHWVDFMMRFELGLEEPLLGQATQSALSVGGAYAVGGIIPLAAYAFTSTPRLGLFYSCVTTVLALGLFGFAKSKVTHQPPFKGAMRTILVGAVAASVAFFVARLIQ